MDTTSLLSGKLQRLVEDPWYVMRNPHTIPRTINQILTDTIPALDTAESGVDVYSEEWDNLIVLDACRYDLFTEVNSLPGVLEDRTSRGSATLEWLQNNFQGRRMHDTVYVSANGYLEKITNREDTEFHYSKVLHEAWDESISNVPPEPTEQAARRADNRFPNKRLIIHYLPPHYPFISGPKMESDVLEDRGNDFWDEFRTRGYDEKKVWTAYRASLKRVLSSVRQLLDEFQGRTVVTSDHGNMIGERAKPIPHRDWGHPRGLRTDELVRVPWLVSKAESRKRIIPEKPIVNGEESANKADSETMKSRLRQLGYSE